MTTYAAAEPLPVAARIRWRDRWRPPWPRIPVLAATVAALLGTISVGSTVAHLELPAPTGEFDVGKAISLIADPTRGEPATSDVTDSRAVRIVAWYPAVAGTGEPAAYVEELDRIGEGLVASGSIGPLESIGLGMVRTSARTGADVTSAGGRHPVAILSPGNATNVEFYGGLAEDLASHGYVVIGVDHPYQSAAVAVGSDVAVYAGDPPLADSASVVRSRIDERVADIGYVLDRLAADAAGLDLLRDGLDLERVAVIGHSNGGLAAVQLSDDPRVRACANLDGQNMAGPFGTGIDPAAPANPFLFLTKETELHPALAEAFEDGGEGAFRVVVPAADHDSFTDGPRFRPRLLPLAGSAEAVMTITRGFTLAFLDHTLRGAPRTAFAEVEASTDVFVWVYPVEPR